MKKLMEWIKSHKAYTAAAALAVVLGISAAVAAASGVFASAEEKAAGVNESSGITSAADDDNDSAAGFTFHVTADKDWGENSTPAIARITGKDEGNTDVDFYHAVMPGSDGNEGTSTIAVDEGNYEIVFISPVNPDGSAYDMPDVQKITVGADSRKPQSVDCTMTQIPAGEVTDEMLQDIIAQTEEAVKKGDETLKDDAGQSILDKMNENVANNPNVSDETKQNADEAKDQAGNKKTDSSTVDKSQSAVPGKGGSSSSGSSGATGSSEPTSSDTGSSSVQESGSPHTHQWKDHIAKRWVSNWVTVVDTPAQTVSGAQLYTDNGDGTWTGNGEIYWFENGFTLDDFKAILRDKISNEGYIGNYVNVSKNVPAVTHQEDQGYYEEYVDYQYCDCGATR